MSLLPFSVLLKDALEHGYAVGYFESWNLESLLAVKDAAERRRSPVIIGFNGGFLGNRYRKFPEDVQVYGSLGKAVAERAAVPMALILNEVVDPKMLRDGLSAGFNAIMQDRKGASFEDFIKSTASLVRDAHAHGLEVEAEIGELPTSGVNGSRDSSGTKTDPEEALRFVMETGVDALAVSIGNVHLLETRKSRLDGQLLVELRRRVPVPLVLHGGTGIDASDVKKAIGEGVCKINVGTLLRRTFINSITRFLQEHNVDLLDPGEVTSTGGDSDMLVAARAAVAGVTEELMKLYGSENRSESFGH